MPLFKNFNSHAVIHSQPVNHPVRFLNPLITPLFTPWFTLLICWYINQCCGISYQSWRRPWEAETSWLLLLTIVFIINIQVNHLLESCSVYQPFTISNTITPSILRIHHPRSATRSEFICLPQTVSFTTLLTDSIHGSSDQTTVTSHHQH